MLMRSLKGVITDSHEFNATQKGRKKASLLVGEAPKYDEGDEAEGGYSRRPARHRTPLRHVAFGDCASSPTRGEELGFVKLKAFDR
jgi:hypothetical protein